MGSTPDDGKRASPYAGRWVARVGGKVVAQGGTPERARLAAQSNRHKEKPEISFTPHASPLRFSPLIDRVRESMRDEEVYLTGGAVRDALLGRASHDFDFAVRRDSIALARRVAAALQADFYVLDESFGAARVLVPSSEGSREILDFSDFRGPDIESDLGGRDFTVNSMAYDLRNGTILDPLDGASDLRGKVIRACSETVIQDDPIRILRAVRQAAVFDFKIEASTRAGMKRAVSSLPSVSAERQRDELFRTLEGPRPDASMRALQILGVFPFLLPELSFLKGVQQPTPHVYDVWEHTLSVLQHLEWILNALAPSGGVDQGNEVFKGLLTLRLGRYREQLAAHFARSLNPDRSVRALLMFAALYHDISKPATKSIEDGDRIRFLGHDSTGAAVAAQRGMQLNLSSTEIRRLETIVRNHMRFSFHAGHMENDREPPSRRAIYRFFRDTGEAGTDLILLGLADLRGTQGHTLSQEGWAAAVEVARILLENLWEKPEESVTPPRLVDGHDIMRHCGLEPGRAVGEVLEAIREGQAAGSLTTPQAALDFARDWLRSTPK